MSVRVPIDPERHYIEERIRSYMQTAPPWELQTYEMLARALVAGGVDPGRVVRERLPIFVVLTKGEPGAGEGSGVIVDENLGVHATLHAVFTPGGVLRHVPLTFCALSPISRNQAEVLIATDRGPGCRFYIGEQGPTRLAVHSNAYTAKLWGLREAIRRADTIHARQLWTSKNCPHCHAVAAAGVSA